MYVGLLHSPPSAISQELTEVLRECSRPPPSLHLPGCTHQSGSVSCYQATSTLIRYPAGQSIENKLKQLLTRSIAATSF